MGVAVAAMGYRDGRPKFTGTATACPTLLPTLAALFIRPARPAPARRRMPLCPARLQPQPCPRHQTPARLEILPVGGPQAAGRDPYRKCVDLRRHCETAAAPVGQRRVLLRRRNGEVEVGEHRGPVLCRAWVRHRHFGEHTQQDLDHPPFCAAPGREIRFAGRATDPLDDAGTGTRPLPVRCRPGRPFSADCGRKLLPLSHADRCSGFLATLGAGTITRVLVASLRDPDVAVSGNLGAVHSARIRFDDKLTPRLPLALGFALAAAQCGGPTTCTVLRTKRTVSK